MTMPTSQPVDYVATINCLIFDQPYIANEDLEMLRSLAIQLTALREAVKGCGRSVYAPWTGWGPCGRYTIYCNECESKIKQIITALTHTMHYRNHVPLTVRGQEAR